MSETYSVSVANFRAHPAPDHESDELLDGDDSYLLPLPPETYLIGKGRPPRDHQFQKGRSGNPRGRPRKTIDLDSLFEKCLAKPVKMGSGGRRRSVPAFEALVMSLIRQAIEGDVRAAKLVFDNMDRIADCRAAYEAEIRAREEKSRYNNPVSAINLF